MSFRASAHTGVGIPRIFKYFKREIQAFTSNRGIATPL